MAKVILALSFGKPRYISSNRLIASLARSLSDRTWDETPPIVADRSVPMAESITVHYIGKEADVHVPTLRLIEEFVDLLSEKGWDNVSLVSQPFYLRRCKRDLLKVLESRCLQCEVSTFEYSSGDWFFSISTQWWNRFLILFYVREALIQALPFWLYKWLYKFIS